MLKLNKILNEYNGFCESIYLFLKIKDIKKLEKNFSKSIYKYYKPNILIYEKSLNKNSCIYEEWRHWERIKYYSYTTSNKTLKWLNYNPTLIFNNQSNLPILNNNLESLTLLYYFNHTSCTKRSDLLTYKIPGSIKFLKLIKIYLNLSDLQDLNIQYLFIRECKINLNENEKLLSVKELYINSDNWFSTNNHFSEENDDTVIYANFLKCFPNLEKLTFFNGGAEGMTYFPKSLKIIEFFNGQADSFYVSCLEHDNIFSKFLFSQVTELTLNNDEIIYSQNFEKFKMLKKITFYQSSWEYCSLNPYDDDKGVECFYFSHDIENMLEDYGMFYFPESLEEFNVIELEIRDTNEINEFIYFMSIIISKFSSINKIYASFNNTVTKTLYKIDLTRAKILHAISTKNVTYKTFNY
jgi:hypothetical protein